ncbi:MAG: ester cyclase [Pseudomonadota bacterium]
MPISGGETHAANKRAVAEKLRALFSAPVESLGAAAADAYEDGARLNAFHPVNEATGTDQIVSALWQPLRIAFPDLERRDRIVVPGHYEGHDFVAIMSDLQGRFEHDWIDIPANHEVVTLRCCEIHRVGDNGRVAETHMLVDTLDLMRQAGVWPIAPSLGAEITWPAPAGGGDADLETCDLERGLESLRLVKAMHAGLGEFDGKDLTSMDHAQFWSPGFMWYGPAGIGTSKGLAGFEAHHQIPFLRGFPDRRVHKHVTNVYDGDFVVTGGWPSVIGTHSGPDWLGTGPTGREIHFRVMDFYRVDGDLIAENWVPIDIADVLRQMGVDVFARVRHLRGQPRTVL